MMEVTALDEPPPSPLRLIDHEVGTRDEHHLNQVEANEPLELVSFDLDYPEATMRIGTRMGPKTRQ